MNDPLFSVPLSEVKELSADTFVIDLLRDDGVLAAHDKVQQRGLTTLKKPTLLLKKIRVI